MSVLTALSRRWCDLRQRSASRTAPRAYKMRYQSNCARVWRRNDDGTETPIADFRYGVDALDYISLMTAPSRQRQETSSRRLVIRNLGRRHRVLSISPIWGEMAVADFQHETDAAHYLYRKGIRLAP